MSRQEPSRTSDIPQTGHRVLKALESEDLCERDLFYRLRPVDRLALHRLLKDMVTSGHLGRYEQGRRPGPVVTMYSVTR